MAEWRKSFEEMNLDELKLKNIGIGKDVFGTIFTFVDYGNVNYWYERDERNVEGNILGSSEKLIIDIEKLAWFISLFSEGKRFYYGWDNRKQSSWHIAIKAERCGFIKNTKPIQFIKHFLKEAELEKTDDTRIKDNVSGKYIEIPKSNFDVEISVDAIRLLAKYNTFCLFFWRQRFYLLSPLSEEKQKEIYCRSFWTSISYIKGTR